MADITESEETVEPALPAVAPKKPLTERQQLQARSLQLREEKQAVAARRMEADGYTQLIETLKGVGRLTPEAEAVLAVKRAEILTGQDLSQYLPESKSVDWLTPTQIADEMEVGVTKARVGKIITRLNLKGDDGKGIEGLSRPVLNKSQHSSKEVTSYVYSPEAVEMIKADFQKWRQEAPKNEKSFQASKRKELAKQAA